MSEPSGAPRPLAEPASVGDARLDALARLLCIVDRLRAPDGCPWDREQTTQSVAPHLVEEAHELVEAVEEAPRAGDAHAIEEAGDVLMGVALLARIAEQEGRFSIEDVARAVSDKLVRRHPHVFGEARADSSSAALANWEAIKKREREGRAEDASAVAGVPTALPALQRARRLADKARAAGFRWRDVGGALGKVREELGELGEALNEAGLPARAPADMDAAQRARVEHELGDLLLAGAFLGSYLGLDPEAAARAALRRFERRFRALESRLERPLGACTLEQLEAAWQAVKLDESRSPHSA